MTLVKSLFVSMAAVLLVASPVWAQDSTLQESPPGSAQPEVTDTDQSESESNSTIGQRLQERKAQLDEQLSDRRQSILARKCSTAQTRLQSLVERVEAVNAKRYRIYDGFGQKFNQLSARLNQAGADTGPLDALLASYQSQLAAMENSFADYHQELSDLVQLDCTEDVFGFQATLVAARQSVSVIKVQAQELHAFIRTQIRPALVQAVSQLDESDEGESSNTTENDNSNEQEQ